MLKILRFSNAKLLSVDYSWTVVYAPLPSSLRKPGELEGLPVVDPVRRGAEELRAALHRPEEKQFSMFILSFFPFFLRLP